MGYVPCYDYRAAIVASLIVLYIGKNSGYPVIKRALGHKRAESALILAVLLCVLLELLIYMTPLSGLLSAIFVRGFDGLFFVSSGLQCVELVAMGTICRLVRKPEPDFDRAVFCLGLLLGGSLFLVDTVSGWLVCLLCACFLTAMVSIAFEGELRRSFCGLLDSCTCLALVAAMRFDTFLQIDTGDRMPMLQLVAAIVLAAAVLVVANGAKREIRQTEGECGESRFSELSPRQQEVLSALIKGKTAGEIAAELGITSGAIGEHKRRAFQRLGIDGIEDLDPRDSVNTWSDEGLSESLRRLSLCVPGFLILLYGLGPGWASLKALRLMMVWSITVVAADSLMGKAHGACCDFVSLALMLLVFLAMPTGNRRLAELAFACFAGNIVSQVVARGELIGARGEGAALVSWLVQVSWKFDLAEGLLWAACLGLALVTAARLVAAIDSRRASCEIGQVDAVFLRAYLESRGLSELQARVAVLCADGCSNREICQELMISPGTVNSYRTKAYSQLGVSGRGDLRELFNKVRGKELYKKSHSE
ncbi:LuxR C-terminal-related transcriptional regulator [Paratractidigestivibacter sp.]|uniref:LuxR C-terminal-related transcriptional regulator n=1 Tax=Paratractidigestivibacter sp. TaxID=2847316 RepID=UPI003AB73652